MTTLDDILQAAHRRYDGSTDYPILTDDDYIVRMGIVNDLIHTWEREPIDWRELIELDYSITATSANEYDLPAGFLKMVSKPKANTVELDFIKPEQKSMIYKASSATKFYTTYGKAGSEKIYINPTITAGTFIIFDYYKKATELTVGTDIPEMNDPSFLVNGLIAFLYEQDARNDKSTEYENKATESLNNMIIANEVDPIGNIETLV